jgi:predicted metal-binding membrane protein
VVEERESRIDQKNDRVRNLAEWLHFVVAATPIDVEVGLQMLQDNAAFDAQARSRASPRRGDDIAMPRARAYARRHAQRAFFGVSALLFAVSATVTIIWCTSMSAMGEMPMPGGWTMSMAWMRMPGQTWPGAAASFFAMWVVMMVAMMLPSLVPMLSRYREAVGSTGEARLGPLTALVAIGYLLVYAVFGAAAFAVGVALAAIEMQQPALARAVPIAVGVVVLSAGAVQFTAWKAHQLVWCRQAPGRGATLLADAGTAWRHGVRLGLHCGQCCANLMLILLVIGVMDLRMMAVVTAAITVERLAPASERVARALGVVIVGAGVFLLARAVGLG